MARPRMRHKPKLFTSETFRSSRMSPSIIIDADAHVSIPENLFAERFPASLQSRRPKRLTVDGDKFFWLVEGRMVPKPSGRGPGTPRGFTPRGAPKDHYLDNVPGRLADMDQEGVAVQVLYPDL